MKISKKRLANKVRKLEVQNYDMRQKIKKMDKALTFLDELTTELNHALPDPEYDAKCEENAIAVGESLDRHAVRLGLKKPELTGSDLALELLKSQRYIIASVSDVSDVDAIECGNNKLIHKSSEDIFTDDMGGIYCWAVPINNQGEPLTASEVGL